MSFSARYGVDVGEPICQPGSRRRTGAHAGSVKPPISSSPGPIGRVPRQASSGCHRPTRTSRRRHFAPEWVVESGDQEDHDLEKQREDAAEKEVNANLHVEQPDQQDVEHGADFDDPPQDGRYSDRDVGEPFASDLEQGVELVKRLGEDDLLAAVLRLKGY